MSLQTKMEIGILLLGLTIGLVLGIDTGLFIQGAAVPWFLLGGLFVLGCIVGAIVAAFAISRMMKASQ